MTAKTKAIPVAIDGNAKFLCDFEGCEYKAKSINVVTRHWNETHRKPHAQKRGTRKRNQNPGSPNSLTPLIIARLVAAFQNGLNKTQAFKYAGTTKDVYYRAIKKDKELSDKMHAAQWHLNMKSREVVASAIVEQKDVQTAKWYLERKAKDEFSLRRETTGAGGGAIKVESKKPKPISLEELHNAVFGDT